MYGYIRLFISVLLTLLAIKFIKPNCKKQNIKFKIIICSVLGLALYLLLMFVPFENCFYTFNSAESTLIYSNLHTSDLTVDGKNTSLTIYKKDISTNGVLIIPKSNKGWKIGRGVDTKYVRVKSNKLYSVDICNYRKTDEYYIILTDWNDEITSLYDNKNSTFKKLSQTTKSSRINSYATYIENFDINYVLTINNQKFRFVFDEQNKTYAMRLTE